MSNAMSDVQSHVGDLPLHRTDVRMVPPTGWTSLTSVHQTPIFVRLTELSSYGEAPAGYMGNSWVTLTGTSERWYVLETMDELTAKLQ